ncbi:MAG TPA: DUF4321 domain-containing protein [bacterium]|jgi:hypothetical protein|nr:DUF4321 domain-containing protein [bacterium]
MARTAGSTFLLIILGGILGGYVGELLGMLVPTGILHDIFTRGFPLGFETPIVLDLRVVIFTFGIKILLNIFSVIGMILGLYYSK